MYLTYPDYLSYGGTLDEPEFIRYEFDAEAIINYRTFSRLKKYRCIPEEVRRLMFVLIMYLNQKQKTMTAGADLSSESGQIIKSQANDGVSISYSGMDSATLYSAYKRELDSAIEQYLDNVFDELGRKLLYRGLYPGE